MGTLLIAYLAYIQEDFKCTDKYLREQQGNRGGVEVSWVAECGILENRRQRNRENIVAIISWQDRKQKKGEKR
jgi:hypothetical protein